MYIFVDSLLYRINVTSIGELSLLIICVMVLSACDALKTLPLMYTYVLRHDYLLNLKSQHHEV